MITQGPVQSDEITALRAIPPGAEQWATVVTWWRAGRLTDRPTLNALITEVWRGAGKKAYPINAAPLRHAELVSLFRSAGFVTNVVNWSPPQQPVRVYRGATIGDAMGMSWTPDRSLAAMFAWGALRHGEEAVLCEMSIAPDRILGAFAMRHKPIIDEYVIDSLGIAPDAVSMTSVLDPEVMETARNHGQRIIDMLGMALSGPPGDSQGPLDYLREVRANVRAISPYSS